MNAHNILYHNNWYNCTRHDYKINRYITFAVLSPILKHYIFLFWLNFVLRFEEMKLYQKQLIFVPVFMKAKIKCLD